MNVVPKDNDKLKTFAKIDWKKIKQATEWHDLSDGCYLLRTNVTPWTDEELWKSYIQLNQAEGAFRIPKSDLRNSPVWHQKDRRVLAHILECFLVFVLWRTFGEECKRAGLGDEPRRILSELSEIALVDVVLPTDAGNEIRTRSVTRPSEHQEILLDRLGLRVLVRIRLTEILKCSEKKIQKTNVFSGQSA